MDERNFGFKKSVIDGSEHIFGLGSPIVLPDEYSYKKFLPAVLDQGAKSICVPCSISAYLNWKENLKDGSKKDNEVNYDEIYGSRSNQGDGMSFKEAFKFIRHTGVNSKSGNLKIDAYAMITNNLTLQQAIVANGPCVGAFPVFNYNYDFWNKRYGDYLLGYHAISIVGYDKNGYIIRNSWGTGFGEKGYTHLPFDEFGKLIEAWTIVE